MYCPITCEVGPRAVMPKTFAAVIRFLSTSRWPELRISIPMRAATSELPETMVPGARGPTASATRGPQRMSLPVTTVSLAPVRMAIPVFLAHTSSLRSTVPLPPSSTMPVRRLPTEVLFST